MLSPASEDDVAEALDALVANGPLDVAFQPIVDLSTAEPIGYEVLGRCGPLGGALRSAPTGPEALLALAERHGRLLALDRRWRELALASIAAQDDDQHRVFFLNVDPRVVEHPGHIPGFTLELVQRHGLSPDRFVLELTEAPGRDPEAIERVLRHYGRQGFRVALDDLGAGQQSLVTLLRVQPHIVKLDRELVRDVHVDASRAHLLSALAEFSRRAGILLVAEGIETPGELAAVVDAGVPCGQGFLLGRPAPRPVAIAAEAREVLRSSVRRSGPRSSLPYGTHDPSLPLLELVEGLRSAGSLEAMLQRVTDGAAALLGVSRASLRLLDEGRTRLLVAARTGEPLHVGGGADLELGEGLAGWVALHKTPLRVEDTRTDPRFVQKPGMIASMRSFLGVPLLDERGTIGVLAATSAEADAFSFVDERWLRVIAGAAAPYLEVARLKRLAITDPLTSARNRRGLEEIYPTDAERDDAPWSAGIVDLDGFKRINDRLGHAAGDDVLRGVVRAIGQVLRRGDHIVRLGGEEFLVVLPGLGLALAEVVLDRVRAAVASAELLPGISITLSAGVAERVRGEACDDLLARADAALYQAKAFGKDRVVVAPPPSRLRETGS